MISIRSLKTRISEKHPEMAYEKRKSATLWKEYQERQVLDEERRELIADYEAIKYRQSLLLNPGPDSRDQWSIARMGAADEKADKILAYIDNLRSGQD